MKHLGIKHTELDDHDLQQFCADAKLGVCTADEHIEWCVNQGNGWQVSEYANMWRASRANWLRILRAAQAEIKRRAEVLQSRNQ